MTMERKKTSFAERYPNLTKKLLILRLIVFVVIPALILTPFIFLRDLIFYKYLNRRRIDVSACAPASVNRNAGDSKVFSEVSEENTVGPLKANGNNGTSPLHSSLLSATKGPLAVVQFGDGDDLKECKIVTAAASPDYLWGIPRRIILSAVASFGLISNSFNKVKTHNLDTLIELVHRRPAGTPLITVSNHTSSLDDPFMWCIWRLACSESEILRWTLTARDVCFTNPYNSFFFRLGKCIPCSRWGSIHQDGMMEAIEVVNRGEWLHVFPEGRLIQDIVPVERLKWGLPSLVARCNKTPVILCIGINGLQYVVPEKFLGGDRTPVPLWGKPMSIVVGEPFQFDMTKLREDTAEAIQNGDANFGADSLQEIKIKVEDPNLSEEERALLLKEKKEKVEAVGDEFTRRLYSEMASRVQEKLVPLVLKAQECALERM